MSSQKSSAAKADAKVFNVENRLARLARQPGGKSIAEALKAAEGRIESVRERCESALLVKAEQMVAVATGDRAADGPEMLDRLYDIANAIFGVAGAFGFDALAEASCSLCDLVYRFRDGEAVNWAAVDVHVDGIRLLATGRSGEVAAETVLAGLRKVRARFVPAT
jgi:hypothetical protein